MKFLKLILELNLLSNIEICAVISDRKCNALDWAISSGIRAWAADFTKDGQIVLCKELNELSPDFIITNVHKVLYSNLVDFFKDKLINLHYSLLPSFSGLIGSAPVEKALLQGCKWTGITVHYLEYTVDTGKPILQTVVPILKNDSIKSLMDIIFRAGCLSLFSFLKEDKLILEKKYGSLFIKDRDVFFSSLIEFPSAFSDEEFWKKIRKLI